jgi:hypothetical protein
VERTLEQRVEALEQIVAELQRKLVDVQPGGRWWEHGPPMTAEQRAVHEAMCAYGRYFRKTGREAPPEWKPGDPIPDLSREDEPL